MIEVAQDESAGKAPETVPYAERLAAIRAAICDVQAQRYGYGPLNGPHRKQRDELILLDFAADAYARMCEATK